MGPAADEIDRQIRETRDQMDEKLDTLEKRAQSGAKRYGRIAAVALGVAVVGVAGYLVYRRVRRPSRIEQLQETLIGLLKSMPDSVRDMPHEVASRLKKPLPSVKIVFNGSDEPKEPGTFESIVRRIAPAVVGTASTAVLERLTRTPEGERSRATPPEYD